MKYLLPILLLFTSCSIRERLDIGSAKAIVELQDGYNESIIVMQKLAETDAKLAHELAIEFPDNLRFQEIAKQHERNAERAAALAKVTRDPYAGLGEFGVLLQRINWLFSDEGLKWLLSIVLGLTGLGGGARIMHLTGKVKRAHQADPNTPIEKI